MRPPRQARSRELVDAILTAAKESFVARGFEGASLSAIADRAGVSVGSIYQYFPDKHAILLELGHRMFDANVRVVEEELEATDGLPPGEAMERGLRRYYASLAEHHPLRCVVTAHIPAMKDWTDASYETRYLRASAAFARRAGLDEKAAEAAAFRIVHGTGGLLDAAALRHENIFANPDFVTAQLEAMRRLLGL